MGVVWKVSIGRHTIRHTAVPNVENKSVGWDDFLTSLFQIIIGVEMTDEYYNDYPTEPIGGDNPYYRCSYCKISDPQINGYLENHEEWCEYRIEMEARK